MHDAACPPDNRELRLKMKNKTLVEYYISVMKRYSNKLLSITDIVVDDAFFSTSSFEKGMSEISKIVKELIGWQPKAA